MNLNSFDFLIISFEVIETEGFEVSDILGFT